MPRPIIWIFFLGMTLSIRCAYSPLTTVHSRMDMKNARVIAVLNFDQEGIMGGEKLSNFAADELTTALYLSKKLNVVDRSHVRSVMLKNNISGNMIETKDVPQLGKLLDSDFIILGKLTRLANATPIPEDNQNATLQIVFRILAARDGSVIGIVECKEAVKTDIQEKVKSMIWKMADSVDIQG